MATALRADIIAHRPNGALAALVEVKNRAGLNRQLAVAMRDGLIAGGALPDVPFFFLISQDKSYLWINRGPVNASAEPDLELGVADALAEYIPLDMSGRLHREELEIVVHQWLTDLSLPNRDPANEAELALARVGFIEAIRGAVLDRDAA